MPWLWWCDDDTDSDDDDNDSYDDNSDSDDDDSDSDDDDNDSDDDDNDSDDDNSDSDDDDNETNLIHVSLYVTSIRVPHSELHRRALLSEPGIPVSHH